MPQTKPPYAPGFRQQMVELVRSGRKPSELSKEFGCHTTSILSWVRQAGEVVPLHRRLPTRHPSMLRSAKS